MKRGLWPALKKLRYFIRFGSTLEKKNRAAEWTFLSLGRFGGCCVKIIKNPAFPLPVKGNAGFVFGSSAVLAELAGTVTDHYIVNFRAAAEFLFETLFCSRDESFVQLIFYQVDGASAETSSHHA